MACKCYQNCNEKYKKAAKTIDVYLNGYPKNVYKVTVNEPRNHQWYHILQDITARVDPYFGKIQKLYSSESGITIQSFSDLQNNGSYVASDFRQYKLVKGGYKKQDPRDNIFQHYLPGQLNRVNKVRKLTHVRPDLIVIYMFNNGKDREPPVKFVLSKDDLYNWEQTLSHIGLVMDVPYTIKSLHNRNGNQICGPWELQHGATYVAVGYHDKFIRRNYRIRECITEIWKNGIPVIQKDKNKTCFHKYKPKSWQQKLDWKQIYDNCECEKQSTKKTKSCNECYWSHYPNPDMIKYENCCKSVVPNAKTTKSCNECNNWKNYTNPCWTKYQYYCCQDSSGSSSINSSLFSIPSNRLGYTYNYYSKQKTPLHNCCQVYYYSSDPKQCYCCRK